MKPYAQEAENLLLLFIAGIASIDDVVAWADRTISTLPEYDDDLVEISLGANLPMDDMDGRLRLVSEGADHIEAVRNLLGRMHRTLLSDRSRARDFAQTVWSVYGEFASELPREFGFMNLFEVIDTENNCSTSFADDLIAETAPFDTATSGSMKPYAQEAENLRLLFIAGIASIDEVVVWADRTISTLPEYDDDLVEISLGAKVARDEMDGRLRRVSEGADTIEAIRRLAGRMHRMLLTHPSLAEEFYKVLDWLWVNYNFPKDIGYAWDPDIRFSKVESGYGWLYDNLIAITAPFDTATPVPTPPLPTSRPSQSESSQKRGKSVRQRLRRFFRRGQK